MTAPYGLLSSGMNAKTANAADAKVFLDWVGSEEFANIFANSLPGFGLVSIQQSLGQPVPAGVTPDRWQTFLADCGRFLDGWAGAYLNRQGYYSAVLETAKAKMEAYEWAYWMEGKPAAKDIKSPQGDLLAKAGAVRDGGSYEQRMGGIACWNAVMDENEYMVRKWNEFVAA